MRAGFKRPDPAAPLDGAAHLRAIPASAHLKGMYFQAVFAEASARGISLPMKTRYVGFKDYAVREYAELLLSAAPVVYPGVPLRDGLRRLGHRAYPALLDSMIGRVVFGVLGRNVEAVLKLANKGFSLSASPGTVDVVELRPGHALVRVTEMWAFADSHIVGVFEGALAHYGHEHEVGVKPLSVHSAELDLSWR